MKLLQQGNWKKEISISHLLERKGCDEFTLLEDECMIDNQRYEVWWYAYKGHNHIVAKCCRYPFTLYFFLLEPKDLFRIKDFQAYMETGDLTQPAVNMFQKID